MNESEKDFLPYKQALELKELGFNEPCFAFFNGKHLSFARFDILGNPLDICNCIEAPTYSQAFRFFREKYELEGVTQRAEDFMWYKWIIHRYNENGKKYVADFYEYKTYEEAELDCLKKLIQIVKEK